MERKYLALNSALLFWLLALVSWCSGALFLTWLFAALSLLSFGTSLLLNQVKIMFKKSKTIETGKPDIALPQVPVSEKEPTVTEKHGTTVIASDVRFEGNIVSGGHVYVHGTLIGNIDSSESLIKIMRGGQVEGNVTCRELIVDGKIVGQCSSDVIEICEHGQVTGTLGYRTLAVKKGGQFSGQAELLPAVAEKNNVVGLMKESTPDPLDLVQLQKL
ncbi:polymer-forming cytoskeletal family protein [Leclercia adecarboxylata]|uniref:Polymer-forming cytoskeletal family protein n=1 Tax=Leclercia adecarboxylata TaxID=83655 RepID=A0AAP9AHY4_9ENTR|nr:polymer-forming cytoskeletal protein [Leclercia adecarboxylata]QDK18321.1 polymer-forming cytoskeletal family protein [Leclercia adecarboxylata]